ncbi:MULTISPECIES: DUF7021 domain-containing protein [Priestia]|uniref:DUF7021 domain-containing protein n=1 Tax=Priestia TaxID=2800373 RepID=UPI00355C7A65
MSDEIILFHYYHQGEAVKKELQLRCLVDEEEVGKSMDTLQGNTVVKLQARRGTNWRMLVNILKTEYRDKELER